jgi:hypothetical protein
MSDGIVTSTNRLKKVYSEYNNNIQVIPNHLPKFIWGDIYPKHENNPREEKPRILWAGSSNHFALKHLYQKNLQCGDFGNELLDFIKKTTDVYDWWFMGAIPVELEEIKHKISFVKWADIFNYPKVIKEIEPDICIAPLQKCIFNDCKSNIKHLEFTAIGAAGIYSNIEPYKDAKLKADTDEEFIHNIEKLAKDIDFRKEIFEADYKTTLPLLFWEDNNNIEKYIESYLNLFNVTMY